MHENEEKELRDSAMKVLNEILAELLYYNWPEKTKTLDALLAALLYYNGPAESARCPALGASPLPPDTSAAVPGRGTMQSGKSWVAEWTPN